MGRIVGELEFTVDANTGRLQAKLAKDGEKSGIVWGKAFDRQANNIGGAGLDKRLAEIRAKAEAALTELDIDVGVNDANARADIARLDGYLKASALELKINPDVDNSELIREIQETRLLLRGVVMNVGADLDLPEALRVKAAAEAVFAKVEMKVKPEVDSAALLRTKAVLDTVFKNAGSSAGDQFGSGLSTRLKAIIGTIAVTAQPAAVALEGLAAASTALLGSAVSGATTGVAALGTQLVGLTNVAAATVVGFAGFGDALGEINTEFAASRAESRAFNADAEGLAAALKNLSPSARETALAFADLRDEFANSQSRIQEQLFKGVADDLGTLSDNIIPNVTNALLIGAAQANSFGKELISIGNETDFADIFERLEPTMENLFDAGLSLVRTIEPFLKSAAPAAEKLSESFSDSAAAIEDFVKQGEQTGDLTEGLERGIESLQDFGRLLIATGDLLATVFSAGQSSGDGFVESLTGIIRGWDQFLSSTQEGQDALSSFFDAGEAILSAFTPVLESLKVGFSTLVDGDAVGNFDRFAEALGRAVETGAVLLDVIGNAGIGAGFLNLFAAIEPVLNVINDLDPRILELVGTIFIATKAVGPLVAGINATASAFAAAGTKIALTNPAIAALTVVVTGALLAFQAFNDTNEQAIERSRELSGVLGETTTAMLEQAGAAQDASLGIEAISESLIATGDDGVKLRDSLEAAGFAAEDATNIIVGLKDAPLETLGLLAAGVAETQFGLELSSDETQRLAALINQVDSGNFDKLSVESRILADDLGLTDEQIQFLLQSVEELQDQEEKTDFSNIVGEFNSARANLNNYDEAVQALIPTQFELAQMTEEELVTAYQAFVRAQQAAARGADDEIAGLAGVVSSYQAVSDAIAEGIAERQALDAAYEETATSAILVNNAITDGVTAAREQNEAFRTSAEAAFTAAQAEEQLERATRNAVNQIARGLGVPGEVASEFQEMGDAAEAASDQADALSSSLDVLFGRALSEQDAFDAVLENINSFAEDAASAAEAGDGFGGSLEGSGAQAIEFRGQLRDSIQSVLDYGVAALESGQSNEEAAAKVRFFTSDLIRNADQFITTGQTAGEYLATLGLTPESLATVISTPGLIEALLSTEGLNYQLDQAGNPVVGGITLEGLDPALLDSGVLVDLLNTLSGVTATPSVDGSGIETGTGQTDELQTGLDQAADTTVDPGFQASQLPGVQSDVDALQSSMEQLDRFTANPSVRLEGFAVALSQIQTLTTGMEVLNRTNAFPVVQVNGVTQATSQVRALRDAINSLSSRTVTVTTNNVSVGENMTGGIITQPMISALGERGYKEAVIPLDLPLNRVDASVRDMAALVRGVGPGAAAAAPVSPGGREVTHNWTINEVGDGKGTARRVINRMAVALT